jgi:hypothetical protein
VKRIDRLPKPTSVAAAMQPLFEAISNAIHSVQNKFGQSVTTEGRVVVTVNTNRKKEGVWATVEDNRLGLDDRNWDAFTTTDTDNKLGIGGKGVGRLLWLDCFRKIDVKTVFQDGGRLASRSFKFDLQTTTRSRTIWKPRQPPMQGRLSTSALRDCATTATRSVFRGATASSSSI